MQTALMIILVVAVLIFGFWLIQYSQFRNEGAHKAGTHDC